MKARCTLTEIRYLPRRANAVATFCVMIAALLFSFPRAQAREPSAQSPEATRDPALAASLPLCFSRTRFNVSTMIDGKVRALTASNRDFKPVSSLDGKTLVFFRVQTYGDGSFETW